MRIGAGFDGPFDGLRSNVRRTALGGAVVLAVVVAAAVWIRVALLIPALGDYPGSDIRFYLDATQRWLRGGGFYEAHELAGPFEIGDAYEVLFPPTLILLFAPFLVLPLALWWAVPVGSTAWFVWHARPSLVGWFGIFVALAFPNTIALLVAGNPVIWGVPALALATRWNWPAALLVLKPTVFPLALFWAGHVSWWIALLAIGLLTLPFWPLPVEYLTVLQNARSPRIGTFLHSLGDVPLLLIPVIASLGARQPGRRRSSTPTSPELQSTIAPLR
jgi:hypothetical protein